jgi:hypothetical protein
MDISIFWLAILVAIGAIVLIADWLERSSRISSDTADGIRAGIDGGVNAHRRKWWHAPTSDDGSDGGGDGGGGD